MNKKMKTDPHDEMRWKRLSSKIIFKHPRITLFEDEVQLRNGHTVPYLRYNPGGKSVTIICIENDQILLQSEYSYPPNEVLYQFPGGKVESGETPLWAAKRELMEESSLKSDDFCEIGWYYMNNRRSDSKMYVVTTKNTNKTKLIEGDIEENIISQWIPIAQFKEMISQGKIVNFSVLAAWALFNEKLNL